MLALMLRPSKVACSNPCSVSTFIYRKQPRHLMATSRQVDSIIEFAGYLQQRLLQNQHVNDLSAYLKVLPLPHKELSTSDRIKLNRNGVVVWNICGRLRKTEQLLTRKELLSQARAFAYFLLESASEADTASIKIALQVAKECLDAKLVEVASKISERAAVLHQTLDAGSVHIREYFLLRLALAWQQDRLDLAEHFFAKLQTDETTKTNIEALNCIDLFLDIGRESLEKRQHETAAKWLGRAVVLFEEHDLSGSDGDDLHVNVFHTYARTLLGVEDAHTRLPKLREVLESLQLLCGADNLAVQLLRLEIASKGDQDAYSVAAAMHHIIQLHKHRPGQARRILCDYVVEILAVHGNDQWIESALTTFIWISTPADYSDGTASIEAAFDRLSQIWTKTPSAETTHGITLILWKRVESAFTSEKYREAATWCNLASHRLLSDNMDDHMGAKFKRKLMECQLNQSEPEAVLEAALSMSLPAMVGSSLIELEWFTGTFFSLALRFHKRWSARSVIQLLGYASQLPLLISEDRSYKDEEKPILERLKKTQAMSLFALVLLHATEARNTTRKEVRIENYEKARDHIRSFDLHISPLMGHGCHEVRNACKLAISEEIRSSFLAQRTTLLLIEFEASLHIPETKSGPKPHETKYDSLSNIINRASIHDVLAETSHFFADMILSAVSEDDDGAPERLISVVTAANLLRQLIDAGREGRGRDIVQKSRWIRCIVQPLLSGSLDKPLANDNISLVEEMADQAIALASSTRKSRQRLNGKASDADLRAVYPPEELEWLATTLFNAAVDFYVEEKEELGRKWAGIAVAIADVLADDSGGEGGHGDPDGGGLFARVLRCKMGELGWSV